MFKSRSSRDRKYQIERASLRPCIKPYYRSQSLSYSPPGYPVYSRQLAPTIYPPPPMMVHHSGPAVLSTGGYVAHQRPVMAPYAVAAPFVRPVEPTPTRHTDNNFNICSSPSLMDNPISPRNRILQCTNSVAPLSPPSKQ
ncbi:hypothetical protein FRC02_011159 [Tulasnella sp. 418]|nr:hypothetical protein FRC02_011159 [Tulasnella sp. 418]